MELNCDPRLAQFLTSNPIDTAWGRIHTITLRSKRHPAVKWCWLLIQDLHPDEHQRKRTPNGRR